MKDDNISQETNNLISSLPADKDFMGYSLYNYKGCWYYPNTLQAVLDVQDNFRPQKNDIILASLPKGGTTWLKSLVFAVVHREKYRENPQIIHPLLSQNPHLAKFPSPMIFSTHMHLNALHEATTKSSSSPCKIVYVCRGLKDTFVSVDAYCRGVTLYGPYWEHMLSYWKGSLEDKENVLFMRYEEIIEEPLIQVKRLAEFLNCPFTEEEEESGNLEINKKGTTRIGIDSNVFFRKGEVGDWKNHLTPQMAKRIDEVVEVKLRGSGLIFP
ncbi:hypothetical protein DY000_02039215 [Brassica cretica]|uniref:Sulfotransferase n=1 Tax=Brassica cretica TaxID=69181 RepID=A0ABQ7B9N0_BRACR|nr:hypothetical protein DY000_02039215 [Brassica cretica]